jgi:hypothetical protein
LENLKAPSFHLEAAGLFDFLYCRLTTGYSDGSEHRAYIELFPEKDIL